MSKVVETARVTTRASTIWRQCASCATLAPLPPGVDRCRDCAVGPEQIGLPRPRPLGLAPRDRRQLVAVLAAPGVTTAREVYLRSASDVLRVAALVEISAAAAALARTTTRLRHLDPALVAPYVRDVVDLYAVLGRGRWLPTMTRHVPAPPFGPVPVGMLLPLLPVVARRARRVSRRRPSGQVSLFDAAGAGGR